MWNFLFAVCFIAAGMFVKETWSFCKPFGKDSDLTNKCGYVSTANFTYTSQYDKAVKTAGSLTSLFSSCSPYAGLISCSLFIPRCEENIPGPYLPCRRVCDEFLKTCSRQILDYNMEFIIGACKLLPEKDNPKTDGGYLGRCFEPSNFKTGLTNSEPLKCSNLVVPDCQNLGYTKTVISEQQQKAMTSFVQEKLKHKNTNQKCNAQLRKLVCMENIIPCVDGKMASYCRPKCQSFFNMNCTSPSGDQKICMEFPKGPKENNTCVYSDWPKALNWPQVLEQQQISVPLMTTRQPTEATVDIEDLPSTTSLAFFSTRSSSSEIKDIKTDSKTNEESSSKMSLGVVLGGAFALLAVIIIVIAIVLVLHRRRREKCKAPGQRSLEQSERLTRS